MTEAQFQSRLIRKLERMFPGCVIMKNDPGYCQGMPDLTILYCDKWATLEVKRSASANVQPNQDYYVQRLSEMSFAAYIYPENEREVLNALQQALEPPRRTRLSKSKQLPLDQLHAQSAR